MYIKNQPSRKEVDVSYSQGRDEESKIVVEETEIKKDIGRIFLTTLR